MACRDACGDKEIDTDLVCERVKKLFGLEYCCYLAKTKSENIAWLLVICYIETITYWDRLIKGQSNHTKKRISERKEDILLYRTIITYSLYFILHALLNKNIRKLLYRFFSSKGSFRLNGQLVLIINSPNKRDGEWTLAMAALIPCSIIMNWSRIVFWKE